VEKLLGHPKTGSIDPPKNQATPSTKGRKVAFSVISYIINFEAYFHKDETPG
jgi:hypothetical protein